jgi:alkaline phosphatase
VAVANPERDGPASGPANDNQAIGGRPLPGFLVNGMIENGAERDGAAPGDTSSVAMTLANHTASDVPLSASGPGALTFTGTYDNTDAFFKMARILAAWRGKAPPPARKR